MAKVVKKPVLPIYSVGFVWLAFALMGMLSSVWNYVFCGAASALCYAVVSALCPEKSVEVPEQPKKEEQPKTTGNKEIDDLLKERQRAISEMRRLNDAIEDEKISDQIDHLEAVTGKIIDHVAQNPKKLPQIRKFMNYYLPTTLKILNAYDRMDDTGISGENISATKDKVERMLDTIVKAFDKQLDGLFGAEALDISTDITVMENLLAREGFGPMNIEP
ncbi:MAG: 5-bromo-4-chloroindolyl phosphate hydrolysis family protein [Oscillospiraceae bacterium]|nr:5-bromo-4-chloroindolyl phosphate hydrolysis family protein [Oscillospiraceae bacterium]